MGKLYLFAIMAVSLVLASCLHDKSKNVTENGELSNTGMYEEVSANYGICYDRIKGDFDEYDLAKVLHETIKTVAKGALLGGISAALETLKPGADAAQNERNARFVKCVEGLSAANSFILGNILTDKILGQVTKKCDIKLSFPDFPSELDVDDPKIDSARNPRHRVYILNGGYTVTEDKVNKSTTDKTPPGSQKATIGANKDSDLKQPAVEVDIKFRLSAGGSGGEKKPGKKFIRTSSGNGEPFFEFAPDAHRKDDGTWVEDSGKNNQIHMRAFVDFSCPKGVFNPNTHHPFLIAKPYHTQDWYITGRAISRQDIEPTSCLDNQKNTCFGVEYRNVSIALTEGKDKHKWKGDDDLRNFLQNRNQKQFNSPAGIHEFQVVFMRDVKSDGGKSNDVTAGNKLLEKLLSYSYPSPGPNSRALVVDNLIDESLQKKRKARK